MHHPTLRRTHLPLYLQRRTTSIGGRIPQRRGAALRQPQLPVQGRRTRHAARQLRPTARAARAARTLCRI